MRLQVIFQLIALVSFLKASFTPHDNYMPLWWLPLLLKSASAGVHLLRAGQLPLHAVMKLLADKTLNCLLFQPNWITKGIRGETESEGSHLKPACLKTFLYLQSRSSATVCACKVGLTFCPFEWRLPFWWRQILRSRRHSLIQWMRFFLSEFSSPAELQPASQNTIWCGFMPLSPMSTKGEAPN